MTKVNYAGEGMGKKLFSQNFKKFFLLQFTQELIKRSVTKEMIDLFSAVKEEKKKKQKEIKKRIKEIEEPTTKDFFDTKEWKTSITDKKLPKLTKPKHLQDLDKIQHPHKKVVPKFKPLPTPRQLIPPRARRKFFQRLHIPETRLPPRLQYLRPTAKQMDIDLGRLNPLIRDPNVKVIESHGANTTLVVKGGMGTKKTKIMLTEDDINQIVQAISDETKIPVHEGVYRVAIGNIMFSAIISDIIGSKFIIKKISPTARFQQQRFPGRFGPPRRF